MKGKDKHYCGTDNSNEHFNVIESKLHSSLVHRDEIEMIHADEDLKKFEKGFLTSLILAPTFDPSRSHDVVRILREISVRAGRRRPS